MSGAAERRATRSRFDRGARAVGYRPLDLIGRGGMAEVWLSDAIFEDGEVERVALKRIRPGLESDVFLSMFEDEVRLGRYLVHPNLVRMLDATHVDGTRSMVMELVEGDSLKGLVDRTRAGSPVLSLGLSLYVMRELAKGLSYAHGLVDETGETLGIVHRDVSPHNVLLGREGQVKLADFGLSDSRTNRTVREPHMVGGKFGYLAPEVVKQKPSDHRVDVFAMGIVLWETLVGRRLFHHEDDRETLFKVMRCEVPRLAEVGVEAPEVVQRLLDGLLEPDPAARIPDASTAAREIQRAIDAVSEPVGPQQVAEVVELHLLGMGGFVDGSARRIRDSESRELDPHGRRTSIPDLDEAERSRPSLTG